MDNKNTQNNDLEKEDKESAAEEKNIVTEKEIKEVSLEEKLKETDEKLLRSLAELENQRRRFEKELKDAFEFGGFNFAKESLALLDNLQRAKLSVKGDEKLKESKDLDTFLNNFEILEKCCYRSMSLMISTVQNNLQLSFNETGSCWLYVFCLARPFGALSRYLSNAPG